MHDWGVVWTPPERPPRSPSPAPAPTRSRCITCTSAQHLNHLPPLTVSDLRQQGTATWGSEYDTEFLESFRREQRAAEATATASRRTELRTPRSLKKGFVHNEDYEKLVRVVR